MSDSTDRSANDVDNRTTYYKSVSDNVKLVVEKDHSDTSQSKEEFFLSTAEKNQDNNK